MAKSGARWENQKVNLLCVCARVCVCVACRGYPLGADSIIKQQHSGCPDSEIVRLCFMVTFCFGVLVLVSQTPDILGIGLCAAAGRAGRAGRAGCAGRAGFPGRGTPRCPGRAGRAGRQGLGRHAGQAEHAGRPGPKTPRPGTGHRDRQSVRAAAAKAKLLLT